MNNVYPTVYNNVAWLCTFITVVLTVFCITTYLEV